MQNKLSSYYKQSTANKACVKKFLTCEKTQFLSAYILK